MATQRRQTAASPQSSKMQRASMDIPTLQQFLQQIGSFSPDLIHHRGTVPRIYHYTDLNGLKGIVENKDLWLTNSRYSNDDEEMIHGLEVVREVITEQLSAPATAARKKFLERVSKTLEAPSAEGVYICCFCQASNLLSQWRGYGANGTGVCLEFDPGGFSFITGPDSPPRGLVRLWSVFYKRETQRHIVQQALDFGFNTNKVDSAEQARKACDAILFFIPTFKNADFAEEKEIRLIFTPNPDFASQPDFRISRGMLTPYYSLQTLAAAATPRLLPLTKILIGPSRHKSVNLESARMLLNKTNCQDVEIEYSKTPYRG
jgi:hypothetical protein